jgi:hypothetical protein
MSIISIVIRAMDPGMKDWLQAAAWAATAVGLVVAATKLWSELRTGRLQRDRDLRWKQAEAGKSLNDEMQTDSRAWPAMQMLDSEARAFTLPSNRIVTITRADICTALDPSKNANDEKSVYIRDCFDALFYFMSMFEHYISNTLIRAEDVAYPIEYYVQIMARLRGPIKAYLEKYGVSRARKFLERYSAWNDNVS